MKNQLIVTLLTTKRAEIISETFKLTLECRCNVIDSRLMALHSEYVMVLRLTGHWDAIAKVETALQALAKKHDFLLNCKRTTDYTYPDNLLPYIVQVIGTDRPGLAYQLCDFFIQQTIIIQDMFTNSFEAQLSQAALGQITMTVLIPATLRIAELRDSFHIFCEDLNIDGILEPEKF